jgi:hypothetical protein
MLIDQINAPQRSLAASVSRMTAAKTRSLNGFPAMFFALFTGAIVWAQDLVPRAYLIAPVGANAINLTSSFFDGSISLDPTVPITDSSARFNVMILSYSRSFALFGRSANVVGSVPYAVGNFRGLVAGTEKSVYRSGLADGRIRIAMNLRGGPAMGVHEFVKWRENFVLGTSLSIITPIGQYDPAKAVNPGLNRWGFKPELGMARRWGRWALDLYGGVWFFTANHGYYPGTSTRTQKPVGAIETHLNYILKPRLWLSLDGNFWTGGRSTVNGSLKNDYQKNSRVGATVSVPLNRQQSLKFSYSSGAYVSIGGNYKNFSAAWQYSWLKGSRNK